ncbi:hypothetical protein HPB47_025306 [Ixodes persulcatus]|uniref:Uncharacterized protein n=1 Tax=Ixodes persulcatus TaxID=34615 RepID=A0AC60Q221_IXOPE|nr:hypothetical protein HPB47_025306 [Ixodes persulcatus]
MAAPGLAQVLSRRASVPPPGKGGHRGRPREDRPHRSGRRPGERARRRVVVRSASALADAAATTPETRNMAFTSSSAKTSRGAPSNGHHAEQDLMDDRSSSPEPVFYSSVKSEKATRHSKRTDAADTAVPVTTYWRRAGPKATLSPASHDWPNARYDVLSMTNSTSINGTRSSARAVNV